MKLLNDSPNHPLRFVDDDKTIGQFYNSWDKQFHLAEYIPYETLPSLYVCGRTGNFSPSRASHSSRMKCVTCWNGFTDNNE